MAHLDIFILCSAFIADWFFGDPKSLPHLIVGYGRAIAFGERLLNRGENRTFKGAVLCVLLVVLAYLIPYTLLTFLQKYGFVLSYLILSVVLLFYCLANRTLIEEGKKVFHILSDQGLEAARKQVGYIVGRETSMLSADQVQAATLETVSENLSDGVIAPLFYFLLFGVPGAMAYKMVNTLDSMIGYRNERYDEFGRVSARIDDLANYIPARLTALLMLLSRFKLGGIGFVMREASKHKSPNAGYPEAALAYLLKCQFGGPSHYYGERVEKAYIGMYARDFKLSDIDIAIKINLSVSVLFVCFGSGALYWI